MKSKYFINILPTLFLIFQLGGMSSCSTPPVGEKAQLKTANFNPVPAQPDSLDSKLLRYRGQTQFANTHIDYNDRYAAASLESAADGGNESASNKRSAGAGEKRDVQESDIFKVGSKGSKLLFLLNNSRGLQVVSFADGIESPKLIGRVEATGNYPESMYYDQEQERLIVLERSPTDQNGGNRNWKNPISRLLVYNVSEPTKPQVDQIEEFEGTIADSRIVGDVLYVATSKRSYYGSDNKEQVKGMVYSFSLNQKIYKIDEMTLSLPVSRDQMNIVEINDNGNYKYYLVAVLRQGSWWWSGKSVIELINISDHQGKIKPLLQVATKGFVNERSQTHIKDNTLIVTTNYRVDDKNWRSDMRIAVETFKLPQSGDIALDEEEYKFRQQFIQRSLRQFESNLAGHISSAERTRLIQEKQDALNTDPETGLKGIFLSQQLDGQSSRLSKPLADTTITVGDDEGQNASIQDVRYVGNRLYVFWVPRNQVDPFDLFDISNPAQEVKFMGRLKFNGFIQRAIPIDYQGKNYVLSLGWIVPIVNNEGNRRQPQAMLFEITQDANQRLSHKIISQITLQEKNVWINFQQQDKFIDVRFTGPGTGVVLFQMQRWDTYQSGGKLVEFNLNTTPTFTEGAFLTSEEGWLRRVFNNDEIDSVNTFSDESLSTFDAQLKAGNAHNVQKAVSILELARNIQGYFTLQNPHGSYGIQLITTENSYGWWRGQDHQQKGKIELRQVNTAQADAEKPQVIDQLLIEFPGNYNGSYLDKHNQEILVLTSVVVEEKKPATGTTVIGELEDTPDRPTKKSSYQREFGLYRIGLTAGGRLELWSKTNWVETMENQYDFPGYRPTFNFMPRWGYPQATTEFLETADGQIFLSVNQSLKSLQGYRVNPIQLPAIAKDKTNTNSTLRVIDGQFYLTFSKILEKGLHPLLATVPADQIRRSDLSYAQNYVLPLQIQGQKLRPQIQVPIQIPGTLVAVLNQGKQFVAEDNRVYGFRLKQSWDKKYYHLAYETETNLVSLEIVENQAVLKDMFDTDQVAFNQMKLVDSHLLYLQTNKSNYQYYDNYRSQPEQEQTFFSLTFDSAYLFIGHKYPVDLELFGSGSISTIVKKDAVTGGYYLIADSGNTQQILSLEEANSSPQIQTIQTSKLGKEVQSNKFSLPGYWWSRSSGGQDLSTHYSSADKTFSFARGLSGIKQVKVID